MKTVVKMSSSKVKKVEKTAPPASSKVRIVNRRNSAAEPTTEDSLSWPQEDIKKLLSRMHEHVPNDDHFSHKSRAKLLPWDEIAFDKYTAEECLHMWKLVLQRIRGFRLLREMLCDAEGWLDRPWSNFYGSKKMNRHPDCPKKPPTAHALYIKENFGKLREKNPNLSSTDIFKLLTGNYKALSEKKKQKYTTKVNILKEEYDREMAIFLKEHPVEKYKKSKPKKLTAFNLFLEHQLGKHKESQGDQPLKKLYNEIRTKWKNLKESKKLLWIQKAEEVQKEVLGTSEGATQPKSLLTKNEKKISDKARGKPVKPSSNVYSLFSRILLCSEELNEYEPKERMKQISVRWKAITQEEKTKLEIQLAKEKKEYATKIEEFYKKYPEEMIEKPIKAKPKAKLKPIVSESSSDEIFQSKKRKLKVNGLQDGEQKPKIKKLEAVEENESVEEPKWQAKEPKYPASDPMKYFARIMKKQKTKFGSEEELIEAWNNLPKKERKTYKKSHAEAIAQYETDYQAFLQSMTPKEKKKYLKSKTSE